jgi:hypothetical protein
VNVYVVGAGLSKCAGYPLGLELLGEIDDYLVKSGTHFDRYEFPKEWNWVKKRLQRTANTLLRESFRKGQFEHLLTVLDLAERLRGDSLDSILAASKAGYRAVNAAESDFDRVKKLTDAYQRYRNILLNALEQYLAHKHSEDSNRRLFEQWEDLTAFGKSLDSGDSVITFNYDATLERILLNQGKWSPSDGYGFELIFQKSRYDDAVLDLPKSQVQLLHLHGATGWFKRPRLREGARLPVGGGAVPNGIITPAPPATEVSLDPIFLRDMGLNYVDACLPDRPSSEMHILLHPSFFKDYELEDSGNTVFVRLWRLAAEKLRNANKVFVIGFSLPKADVAALTLLSGNCDPNKVEVVNSNQATFARLRNLLSNSRSGKAQTIHDWLKTRSRP